MKTNRKMRKTSLLICILSIAVFTGSMFAFFSDRIEKKLTVTAGTLEVDGDFEIYYNGTSDSNKVTADSFTNFNPGDYLVVKGNFTNTGTKSAWIRHTLTLSGGLTEVTDALKVYNGVVTSFDSVTASLHPTDGTASEAKILNGTTEKETVENVISEYPVEFTIYFNKDAPNEAQGKSFNFEVNIEALQYRNNTNPDTTETWLQVKASDWVEHQVVIGGM